MCAIACTGGQMELAAFHSNSSFYWGRRAAYELARRLLLARLAHLVGEEAMLLYGRRG